MAALYDRLKGLAGGDDTVDAAGAGASSSLPGPQALFALLVPLGAVVLITALRRRSEPAGIQQVAVAAKESVAGVARKRHKPKNLARYYGIGVLIGALERDSSRKTILAGLKWMQRRA